MIKETTLANSLNNSPQVSYTNGGRSGTIYYKSPGISFDVWYELAMPPSIAIIGIPEPQFWEYQTKTPVSERTAILQFIGAQVVNDKLSGEGYARIEQDNIMTIYKGKDPDSI